MVNRTATRDRRPDKRYFPGHGIVTISKWLNEMISFNPSLTSSDAEKRSDETSNTFSIGRDFAANGINPVRGIFCFICNQ